MRRAIGLLIASCLGLGVAGADRVCAQSEMQTKLASFLQSQQYKSFISRDLARLPPTVFKNCTALVSGNSQITIIEPVSFDQNGVPASGRWRHAFPVRGCGNDTVLNFFFVARPGGQIESLIGLPGTTLADPLLQRDALTFATTAAGIFAKTCTSFDVTNTRFEAFGLSTPATADPGTAAHFRPWWETWTLVGCGRSLAVPMNFVPDSTGTQVTQPGNVRAQ